MKSSILINDVTWIRKMVFDVYDKTADSSVNTTWFRSEIYKT